MGKEDLVNRIKELMKGAVQTGINYAQPRKQHTTLANKYSGGAKAYYDNKIDELLLSAPDKSFMAQMWINGGCPNLTDPKYRCVEQISELYINVLYGKIHRKSDADFLKFVQDDLQKFFIIYFTYVYLKSEAIRANTKAMYDISLSIVSEIYNACYPDVFDCHPLVFCNAVYNPDTFCNIQGVKSNLMLFVNLVSKIKGLGVAWKRAVCQSMGWDEKECSKRSVRNDIAANWCNSLKKIAASQRIRK